MADAGMHVPALETRPCIIGYRWLWEAYNELDSCRQSGMGVGRIPWTAVQQYSEVNQFNEEETWMLHAVVHHLDSKFIEHHEQKAKMNKPQGVR